MVSPMSWTISVRDRTNSLKSSDVVPSTSKPPSPRADSTIHHQPRASRNDSQNPDREISQRKKDSNRAAQERVSACNPDNLRRTRHEDSPVEMKTDIVVWRTPAKGLTFLDPRISSVGTSGSTGVILTVGRQRSSSAVLSSAGNSRIFNRGYSTECFRVWTIACIPHPQGRIRIDRASQQEPIDRIEPAQWTLGSRVFNPMIPAGDKCGSRLMPVDGNRAFARSPVAAGSGLNKLGRRRPSVFHRFKQR